MFWWTWTTCYDFRREYLFVSPDIFKYLLFIYSINFTHQFIWPRKDVHKLYSTREVPTSGDRTLDHALHSPKPLSLRHYADSYCTINNIYPWVFWGPTNDYFLHRVNGTRVNRKLWGDMQEGHLWMRFWLIIRYCDLKTFPLHVCNIFYME